MICPYCAKSIHFSEIREMVFQTDYELRIGRAFEGAFCPACHNLIVITYTGEYNTAPTGGGYITQSEEESIIYPSNKSNLFFSDDIPTTYLSDFIEAKNVLLISPKASAALSRRCLQNFLNNELKIKENNLAKEIEKFIATQKFPSYIIESVDAVRKIGNLAAHPLKNTNTGEIVEVEPAEADWLLEVLEMLFDFYFIYPKKIESRKMELNEKLKNIGKLSLNHT